MGETEGVPLLKRDPPFANPAYPDVLGTHWEDGDTKQFKIGLLLGRNYGGLKYAKVSALGIRKSMRQL